MMHFRLHQRVRIWRGDHADLIGRAGTVVRLRRGDDGAWVRLDEHLDAPKPFPDDDPDGRGNDLILYPDECEPLRPES